jgi:hypothetical protein
MSNLNKIIFAFIFSLSFGMLPLLAENLTINQTFTEDSQFNPFTTNNPLYGISFTGNVTLNGDQSLLRVILVTNTDEELLIYEVFPSVFESEQISEYCYETCFLDALVPASIKVIVIDASVTISTLQINRDPVLNPGQLQLAVKEALELERVERINQYITDNDLAWYAGINQNLELSYNQKKELFEDGIVPNLQGMEYYVGGYFSFGTTLTPPPESQIVGNFDWRSRHGANRPDSPYFDGDDENWSSWIPPRFQQQGPADCYAFAPTYTIQALTNLYFNQHLDINLAEQDPISCIEQVSPGQDGGTGRASRYITEYGIVNEDCFPYAGIPVPDCSEKCENPDELIQPDDYDWYLGTSSDDYKIKRDIIENGTLVARTFTTMGHAMMLVGYGSVKAGDEIFFVNPIDEQIIVPPGSPYIGQTYWIFEQSWGIWNNGTTFIYIIIPPEQLRIHIMKQPLTSLNYDVNDIPCLDEDGDGFYYWGIGEKPPTCPECPAEPDCDDSNPWLGPFDEEFNCQLLCENFVYQPAPYEINGTITLQDINYFDGDVIVTSGSELIVEGEMGFVEGAKLVIERNAILRINGGLLTSTCDNYWLGVELHGTSDGYQNPLDQGVVYITEGGTIENAIVGIRTCKTAGGFVVDGYSGGIILASNAEFINNLTAIHFYPYPLNKVSNFLYCLFETDENLLEGNIPDYFVKMNNVRGVNFTACEFSNASGIDYLHSGIYAYNSLFLLAGKCIYGNDPCITWDYGNFRYLYYGVYALYAETTNYPDIRHQMFSWNKRGVYISGADGARVASCQFMLPPAGVFSNNEYGMYLDHSRFYHIESNNFSGAGLTVGELGLYINNSGADWNQVYNNYFTNLYYGTVAYGVNRNEDGSVGLCIKCNDYEANKNDIVVNGIPRSGHGIAYNQGFMHANDTAPAGNTFTQGFQELEYNYINSTGMGWINYVYHGNVQMPVKVNPDPYFSSQTMSKESNDWTYYWNKEVVCPSKLTGGGGGGHELIAMAESDTEIAAIETQLATLVDDGDTPTKTHDVMTGTSLQTGDLYDDLMAGSPFLSDTVLKSAIYKEDVFPSAMIRDVLVANPQSAKSHDIIESLDNRWDQMPGWMIDQIMEGVDITGAKEAIERNLAGWKHKRGEHFTNLYRHYLYDGVNQQATTDSLELLLSGDNSLNSKYGLAMLYAGKGDYASMNAVIGSIPGNFSLTSVEQAIHQDYATLCGILQQLDGNLPDDGSAVASALMVLAEEEEYFPGACARNILLAAGLIQYQEPVILPDLTKSSKVKGGSFGKGSERPDMLKVFPNPAKDFLVVDYNTDGEKGEVLLTVTDMKGYTVHSEAFALGRDQVVVGTTGWEQGTYVVSLTVNGKPVANSKVTVQ